MSYRCVPPPQLGWLFFGFFLKSWGFWCSLEPGSQGVAYTGWERGPHQIAGRVCRTVPMSLLGLLMRTRVRFLMVLPLQDVSLRCGWHCKSFHPVFSVTACPPPVGCVSCPTLTWPKCALQSWFLCSIKTNKQTNKQARCLYFFRWLPWNPSAFPTVYEFLPDLAVYNYVSM